MVNALVRWLLMSVSLLIVSYIVPGFSVTGIGTALVAALVFGFLPPAGRNLFFNVYGAIADETARLARFKALESAVAIVAYGHDTGKLDLLREGQAALRHVLKS